MMKRTRHSLLLFLFLSLLAHLLTWSILQFQKSPTNLADHSQPVEVEYLETAPRAERNLKQIVQQETQLNDEVDPEAKYLSQFNQRVVEETRARNSGAFKNASGGAHKKSPTPSSKSFSLSDLRPGFNPLAPQARPQPTPVPGPSQGESSATDDYLRDVKTGMETMLSTREFVYYSYYQRIKERLRQHWEPSIRARMKSYLRQGRNIASTHDHVTQVLITLNRNGELVRVEVVTPSGLQLLDEAATDAFRSAQPFPNPPNGMVEKDGNIRIRWDFILEAKNLRIRKEIMQVAEGEGYEDDPFSGL